jgi:hypothetical protein
LKNKKSIIYVRNKLKEKYEEYEKLWNQNKKTKNFYKFLNEENYKLTQGILKCVKANNIIIKNSIENEWVFNFMNNIFEYEIRMYKRNKYKILQTNKLNFNLSRYLRIVDRIMYSDKYDKKELILEMFFLLISSFSNIYYYFDGIGNNFNQIILYIPTLYKKKEIYLKKKEIILDYYDNNKCQYFLLESYTNLNNIGYVLPNVIFRYLVDNYINFEYYSYIFSLIIKGLIEEQIKIDKKELELVLNKILNNYYSSYTYKIILNFLEKCKNENKRNL